MTDTEDINHTFAINILKYHENPSCLEILYLICHTKNTFEIDIKRITDKKKNINDSVQAESQAPHTMRKVASLPSNPKLFLILFGITTSKYI